MHGNNGPFRFNGNNYLSALLFTEVNVELTAVLFNAEYNVV